MGKLALRPLLRRVIIAFMEALTALFGAVVGGLLVLVGEILPVADQNGEAAR
ncbi:hypothetical protein O7600_27930 [Micromonospora sp. WMMA1998]|uniref:hypothetical protein n=1 Tax=Micromonospora sp. WMMA1998 TaxID=3015167 RepID=UPI00248B76B6|nr:hypothetical protein [Micromonospora sp. WMMA1998]WBC14862.1 hypothetical protein O7600_27930 [Micromonospora sp. WMMA1998]